MPPENTRKPKVLRGSQIGKLARNGLTQANSGSFVALGQWLAVVIIITLKLLSHSNWIKRFDVVLSF